MEKKRLISLMLAGIMATSVGTMAGCGDEQKINDYNSRIGEYYKYVVVEENDIEVLHKIEEYKEVQDSNKAYEPALRTIILKTDCCDNEIRTMVSKTTMYQNKPSDYAYDEECELCK